MNVKCITLIAINLINLSFIHHDGPVMHVYDVSFAVSLNNCGINSRDAGMTWASNAAEMLIISKWLAGSLLRRDIDA